MKRFFSSITLVMGLVVYAQAAKDPAVSLSDAESHAADVIDGKISDLAIPEKKQEAMHYIMAHSTENAASIRGALSKRSSEIKLQLLRLIDSRNSGLFMPQFEHLIKSDPDVEVRLEVLRVVASYKNNEPITKIAIKDKEAAVRASAVFLAAERNGGKLPDYAKSALHDESSLVRLSAEYVAAKSGDRVDLEDARKILKSGRRGEKSLALKVIAYGGRAPDMVLVDRLARDDESFVVRGDAVLARFIFDIRDMKTEDRIKFLSDKLSDKRNWVRSWAAEELAFEYGDEGIQILKKLASSGRGRVGKLEAEKALWKLDRRR